MMGRCTGKCEECRHWDNAMFGDWGACKRMRSDKDHHPIDGDTWAHSEGANGSVTTAGDFGCIMFQPKASDDEQPSAEAIEIAYQAQDYSIGTIEIAQKIEAYVASKVEQLQSKP